MVTCCNVGIDNSPRIGAYSEENLQGVLSTSRQ